MVMVEKTDMTAEMEKTDKTVQVERLKTLPVSDGFHMPGEFEPRRNHYDLAGTSRLLGLWGKRCQKSLCKNRRGYSRRRRGLHVSRTFFLGVCKGSFFRKVRKDPYFAYRNGRCLGKGCRTYLC